MATATATASVIAMETCGDGCEDGNCDCAVTGVAEWPQPRKRKANVSPTCAAGPADDGFDDELAMKVLGDMVETLRPGTTKSTWTMQDQFHLVIFEWLSQIQPGQSQPHDGLVKAIGVAKAKIAPERIRKLRKDIPKVMSLVADARKSSTAEFKRVVELRWTRGLQTKVLDHMPTADGGADGDDARCVLLPFGVGPVLDSSSQHQWKYPSNANPPACGFLR